MSVGIAPLATGLSGIRTTVTSDSFPEALCGKVCSHADVENKLREESPGCWFSTCLQITLDREEVLGRGRSCRKGHVSGKKAG